MDIFMPWTRILDIVALPLLMVAGLVADNDL